MHNIKNSFHCCKLWFLNIVDQMVEHETRVVTVLLAVIICLTLTDNLVETSVKEAALYVQAKNGPVANISNEKAESALRIQSDNSMNTNSSENSIALLYNGSINGMTSIAGSQIAKVMEVNELINENIQKAKEDKALRARELAEQQRIEKIEAEKQRKLAEAKKKAEEEAKRKAEEAKKKAEEAKKRAEAARKKAEAEKKYREQTRTYKIKISSSERQVLERIVQAEAGNQDMKGKILVANVIMNRVKDRRFPKTVKGVVFEHSGSSYQFSPVKNGSIYRVRVSSSTKEAVTRALKGENYSRGALYFVARSSANRGSLSWFDRALTRLFTHGGHTFYR